MRTYNQKNNAKVTTDTISLNVLTEGFCHTSLLFQERQNYNEHCNPTQFQRQQKARRQNETACLQRRAG